MGEKLALLNQPSRLGLETKGYYNTSFLRTLARQSNAVKFFLPFGGEPPVAPPVLHGLAVDLELFDEVVASHLKVRKSLGAEPAARGGRQVAFLHPFTENSIPLVATLDMLSIQMLFEVVLSAEYPLASVNVTVPFCGY